MIPFWVFRRKAHLLAKNLTYFFISCFKIAIMPIAKKGENCSLTEDKIPKTGGDFGIVPVTPSLASVSENLKAKCFIGLNYSWNKIKKHFGFREMGSTYNALIAIQNYLVERKPWVRLCTHYFIVHVQSIWSAEALGHHWSLGMKETYHQLFFVNNVFIGFLGCRTQRVASHGDISESLPLNQGAQKV